MLLGLRLGRSLRYIAPLFPFYLMLKEGGAGLFDVQYKYIQQTLAETFEPSFFPSRSPSALKGPLQGCQRTVCLPHITTVLNVAGGAHLRRGNELLAVEQKLSRRSLGISRWTTQ